MRGCVCVAVFGGSPSHAWFLFLLDCIHLDEVIKGFLQPGSTGLYYKLLATPYDDASDAQKQFWSAVMMKLMPYVSKDWHDRLKGTRVAEGDEDVSQYVTCSDFAYIPMVIRIYGEREVAAANVAGQRKKGRTKGQTGMMCKESIALYCESVLKMKEVLENEQNVENIKAWSDAIIHEVKAGEAGQGEFDNDLDDIAEAAAARAVIDFDFRRVKRDEIVIPV